jgi:2-isopropylmalate synthase
VNDDKRIFIFDTTLRDGEQSLPASLSVKDKLKIAKALEHLQVDIMEVGFPISSPGDFESVQTIAREIKNSVVCGLARCLPKDIDVCAEAIAPASRGRIHVFLSTSTVHVESKLKKSWEDVLEMAVAGVKRARQYSDDVEFSCEDTGRTPLDRLYRIVEAVIAAGATTVNLPDTVGYNIPSEFGKIIANVKENVANIDRAIISVHCHDDLGLSVANSVAAVQNGARQIECTINGIGERAGNCSLEEVVMILKTRGDLLGGIHTGIDAKKLHHTSKLVSQICGVIVQPNKAIVGANAFAHSSGIHQDGVLKNRSTYEIMTPESVGIPGNVLHMTSRSGRHVLRHCLENLGFSEGDYDLEWLYKEFLHLADRKGKVYDYDLEALVMIGSGDTDEFFKLNALHVMSGKGSIATATVELLIGSEIHSEAATGSGPVGALYKAIDRLTRVPVEVLDYKLAAKGKGSDALGQVDIVGRFQGLKLHGVGLSTDIIEASALAYIHLANNIVRAQKVATLRDKYPRSSTHEAVAQQSL